MASNMVVLFSPSNLLRDLRMLLYVLAVLVYLFIYVFIYFLLLFSYSCPALFPIALPCPVPPHYHSESPHHCPQIFLLNPTTTLWSENTNTQKLCSQRLTVSTYTFFLKERKSYPNNMSILVCTPHRYTQWLFYQEFHKSLLPIMELK